MIMADLSGNSIQSLSEKTNVPIENSLFLVAAIDDYVHTKYQSKCIDARSLMQYCTKSIVESIHFGTMSSETSGAYSLIDHNHDNLYNKCEVDSGYLLPMDDPTTPKNWLSIGNIFVDGDLSTLFIDKDWVELYINVPLSAVEPKAGTLKFMAKDTIVADSSIDVTKSDFDGWVYPRGQQYRLNAFRLSNDIEKMFSVSDGKFTVPCISNFIKDGYSNFNKISYQNVVPYHFHDVSPGSGSISAEISAKLEFSSLAGNGGKFHSGNGKTAKGNVSRSLQKNQFDKKDISNFNYTGGQTVQISSLSIKDSAPEDFYSKFPNGKESTWEEIWTRLGNKQIISPNITIELTADSDIIKVDDATIESAGVDKETYPTHNLLPIMVYLGKKMV